MQDGQEIFFFLIIESKKKEAKVKMPTTFGIYTENN